MQEFKTYSELITYHDFLSRVEYLAIHQKVAEISFGYKRYLNQVFYHSPIWKDIREKVIIRDNGCDLGCADRPIIQTNSKKLNRNEYIYIHHIIPLTDEDIINMTPYVTDPEYLISTTLSTHNAIHYGDINLLKLTSGDTERKPGDTNLW